jgi:hypothetical protein
VEGALYFNSTTDTSRVYNGTAWQNVAPVATTIDLATQVTGTLAAANGGTGITSPGTLGNVLTSTGTTWSSAPPAAGGLEYVVKTANYTTFDKEGVLADTSGGAFTVTLPATPATGAQVVVADSGSFWGTNNLTVGRNGSTIGGLSQDLVCDITGVSVQLVYDGSTWEVYAQIGGNGGTAVTLDGTQTLTNKTLTAPTIASANLTTALTLAGAAGTNGQVLTSAGSGLPSWTTLSSGFTLGTPVATTSGTSIDFTGIPAGVKQIIISFDGVSTNGTSEKTIRLGDAGGIETTGYNSTSMRLESTGISPTSSTSGFEINSVLIGDTMMGSVILTLENSSTNVWAITGILTHTSASQFTLAGRKPLSAVLDRVRLTTAGGVNTFDAGEINIAYI